LTVAAAGCARVEPPAFTGEAAWRYLVRQCEYGPRVPGTAARDSVTMFIADHLRRCGAEVSLQRFEVADPYSDRSLELINVIGVFSPSKEKRVLLSAHYDTRPWADRDPVDSLRALPITGANDGASGVAVLLELAELVGERPPPDVAVELVFFDGEDYGKEGDLDNYLLGSTYYAANVGPARPRWGILLDMVGAKDARIRQEGYSLDHARDLTRALYRRAARLGLSVFVPARGPNIYDDQVPLIKAGIPTVDLIGWPYRYWHTMGDTPDKCSRETLRQVGVLVADFLYHFPF